MRPSRTCTAQNSHVNLWSQSSYHSKHMRPSELISGGKKRRAARVLTRPQARLRILIFDPPKLGAVEEFLIYHVFVLGSWSAVACWEWKCFMLAMLGQTLPQQSSRTPPQLTKSRERQWWEESGGQGKKARSWHTSQVSRILTVERVLSTFPANTATDSMLSLCYWPRNVLAPARLLQMWCTPTLLAQQLW